MIQPIRRAGAIVAAVLVMLPGTATAQPPVTITEPVDGAVISRAASPQTTMEGTVEFETPVPETRRWNMRRSGCGTANDNARLSVTSGSDGGSGCSFAVGALGLNEVFQVSQDYPAVDGTPFTLDSSRALNGRVVIGSFFGSIGGAGQVVVEIRVTASGPGGAAIFASTTEEYIVLPHAAEQTVNYTMAMPPAMDKRDFTSLNLNLLIRGVNVLHGFVTLNGQSWIDMPTYTASFDRRVETAVDNGTFDSSGMSFNEELTQWSQTIATPSVGPHFVRARAVQGTVVGPTVSHVINVTD